MHVFYSSFVPVRHRLDKNNKGKIMLVVFLVLLSDGDTLLQWREVLCRGFHTLSLLVMEAGLSSCSEGHGAQPLSSPGPGRKSDPPPMWSCVTGEPSWSTCPSLLFSVRSGSSGRVVTAVGGWWEDACGSSMSGFCSSSKMMLLLRSLPSHPSRPAPSSPETSLAQQDRGTGAGLVALQLLVLPDLLQQPHKQNTKGSTGRTESWGGGEWDQFFCWQNQLIVPSKAELQVCCMLSSGSSPSSHPRPSGSKAGWDSAPETRAKLLSSAWCFGVVIWSAIM